jgi:hypothetical protein
MKSDMDYGGVVGPDRFIPGRALAHFQTNTDDSTPICHPVQSQGWGWGWRPARQQTYTRHPELSNRRREKTEGNIKVTRKELMNAVDK